MPTQPRPPTHGGLKKVCGELWNSIPCRPGDAGIRTAMCPSSWWLLANLANTNLADEEGWFSVGQLFCTLRHGGADSPQSPQVRFAGIGFLFPLVMV